MRLIDADALPVKEFLVVEDIYGNIGRYMVVHKAALDAAPTIESEPVRHGRLIPCSERMPEANTQVLCYCRMGDFRIMEYDDQAGRWYEGIHDYRKQAVTHWMLLPEPPKEDENE